MSKKLKIAIVLAAVLLLAVGALVNRKAIFKADEGGGSVSVSANLSLEIAQADGTPALGTVYLDGDCPESSLSGSDGIYICRLTSTDSVLKLSSLYFYDFSDDTGVTIPLHLLLAEDPGDFTLENEEDLILKITLPTSNQDLIVKRFNQETKELTDFPTN